MSRKQELVKTQFAPRPLFCVTVPVVFLLRTKYVDSDGDAFRNASLVAPGSWR